VRVWPFAGTDGSVSDVDVVDTNVCSNYVGIWNETDMAGLSRVSISGGAIRSNTYNGVRSNGRTVPTAWTPTDVSIVGTVFASNGQSSNSFPGSGDVSFYEFNGSATLTNVTVATTGRNPVQFRGRGTASTATWLPSGAVSINGLTVTGTADRSAIVIQNYSDVAAVTLSNVNLAGVTNTNPPGTGFSVPGMTLTHTGATPLVLGNTVFPCQGAGYVGLAVFGSGGAAADCTTVFTGATTLAGKEACVFDGDDLAGFGNVSFPDSVITGQPTSATVCDGQPVTLTVSATGDNLSYQWFNGANPVGTNSASYSIPAASGTDAGTYTVVVTGTCGAVTSSAATVTVNTAPVVAALPAAPTICAGSGFVLTAAATGTGPFSYQWRKDGSPMLTETGVTFSINVLAPGNAGSYDVVVTNTCGSTTSTTSVLTVGSAPVITSQPAPASVAIGGTGSFSVAASATPGPLGYQWCRNGINLPNAGPYGGANTPTLTISPASLVITGSFDCIVTAPCGTTTSAAALLSVGSAPVITQQPLPAFVRVNDCVKLVAAATGGNPLTVQWRKDGLPLADGGSYSGVSTLSLTICPVTPAEGGNYELVATNPFGTATSNPAAVAINPSCNCADIVSSLALPPGDGTIDGNDFISFINAFAIDDPLADIAGPEGCSPDGTIDGFDFIAFINDFAAGCP
jgi:hypothetical protein